MHLANALQRLKNDTLARLVIAFRFAMLFFAGGRRRQ
jgi:hypothetical protein